MDVQTHLGLSCECKRQTINFPQDTHTTHNYIILYMYYVYQVNFIPRIRVEYSRVDDVMCTPTTDNIHPINTQKRVVDPDRFVDENYPGSYQMILVLVINTDVTGFVDFKNWKCL